MIGLPKTSFDWSQINRILVLKLRQLGDVLLTVPVFRTLRAHFPQAHLAALVNAGTEGMLQGHPALNEVITFDRRLKDLKRAQQWRRELQFIRDLRRRGFDLVVDLTGSDRAAWFAWLSGARHRWGSDLSRVGFWGKPRLFTLLAANDGGIHIVRQNLAVLEAAGLRPVDFRLDFHLPPPHWEQWRRRLAAQGWRLEDAIVQVHPTSNWLFKCWRDEAMAAVISWLLDQGIKVILTAAPLAKERAKAAAILAQIRVRPSVRANLLDLSGQTDLGQLAAVTASARLFLGVDSMPMHLAAALGTPVLALFGPSILWRWAPWSPALAALENPAAYQQLYHHGVYHLGPHRVIQRQWTCLPCYRDGCGGSKISKCLEDITPAEVIHNLEAMLAKAATTPAVAGAIGSATPPPRR